MAKKMYNESDIGNIANAIRDKNGKTDKYYVSEMADAIKAIPSGSEIIPSSIPSGYVSANSNDILYGKSAWLPGDDIKTPTTGTITSLETKTYTPGIENQIIDAGQYLSGQQIISGDSNLVSENIKKDISIFGVAGTAQEGTDTSDATVDNTNQIVEGYSAYSNETKYEGTLTEANTMIVAMSAANTDILSSTSSMVKFRTAYARAGDDDFSPKMDDDGYIQHFMYDGSSYNATSRSIEARMTYTLFSPDNVLGSETNAIAADVLSGKRFTSGIANGWQATGTMSDYSSSTDYQTVTGTTWYDEDSGGMQVSVGGVDINPGYYTKAYFDVNANIPIYSESATTITPSTKEKTIASGQYMYQPVTITGDANLTAENIKSGVSIFGVNGSYVDESWAPYGKNMTLITSFSKSMTLGECATLSNWDRTTTTSAVINTYSNAGTFSPDMANYDYIIKMSGYNSIKYTSTVTAAVKEYSVVGSYFITRIPSNYTNLINGVLNYNTSTAGNTNAYETYLNTSGSLSRGVTNSYGIYLTQGAPAFSSTSSDYPTVTVRYPYVYGRCSSTYLSTTSAELLDEDNTIINMKVEVYRVDRNSILQQQLSDARTILINGGF